MSFRDRLSGIMNRALSAVTVRFHVAAANVWREAYNPLRGLSIQRAVTMLEQGERGALAELQWTYRYIEMQDATLGALLERRTSAIQKLDWAIKIREDLPAEKKAVAERQAAALKDAYGRLKNFSCSLEALALASFRGFAHLEKVQDGDGNVVELAPVEQWFWCRKGIYGDWTYNRQITFGKNEGEPVPLPRLIIREVSRPINRVALICFVRKGLSQKDWDGFVEAYGIPAVFILMPPNVPEGQQEEYLSTAEQVSSDARGVLPSGSDVKTVDNGARGNNPFKQHIDYQDSQVILRGTGGKLTMLAEATGMNSGNADAHEDTFKEIAQAEAREISELLQANFDADIIAATTPGEQAFAYWELAANEETDTGEVVKDVASLKTAGYQVEVDWLKEKTGYPVTLIAPPAAPALPVTPPAPGAPALPAPPPAKPEATPAMQRLINRAQALALRNRAITSQPAPDDRRVQQVREAHARDVQAIGEALAEVFKTDGEDAFRAALTDFNARTPELLESPEMELAMAEAIAAAFIEGLEGKPSES